MESASQITGGKIKLVVAVIFCVTTNACIASILASVLPVLFTKELDIEYFQISVVLVVSTVVSSVFAHYIGKWSDRGGNRAYIAIFSAVLGIIGFLIMASFQQFAIIFIALVTFIAIANSLFPQFMALAYVIAPEKVPLVRAFASLGWVIGPPAGGFLIAVQGYSTTFFSIAGLYVCMIIVVALAFRFRIKNEENEKSESSTDGSESRQSKVFDLVVILSCLHFLMAIPSISIPLRIVELGGTEFQVGLAFGIAALIEIPLIVFAGRIRQLYTPRLVFSVVAIGLAAYFIMLYLSNTPVLIIGSNVVNGIITGIMMGYGLIILQDRLSSQPGLASAIYTNILRLTHIVALLVSGMIAQYISFPALFIIASIISLSSIAIFNIITTKSANQSV